MKLAKTFGWCGFHIRYSQAATRGVHTLARFEHIDGWGFPDWVFVKPGRPVKFRELKSEAGRLSRHQRYWQELLHAAGADCAVWRPSMLDEIAREFAW